MSLERSCHVLSFYSWSRLPLLPQHGNEYLDSPTHDPSIDTFRVEYLVGPCMILALIFHYKFKVTEILWSFSIFLESVAILPQLFMLQRTGEAETITTHYLAALGAYRAFYIPNWIYRYALDTVLSLLSLKYGADTGRRMWWIRLRSQLGLYRLHCTSTSSTSTSQSELPNLLTITVLICPIPL